jgi:HSP20 family protein
METRRKERLVPGEPFVLGGPRSVYSEFDHFFDEFKSGLEDYFWRPRFGPLTTTWMGGVRHALVDIKDLGKEFLLTAEVPGVKKEDLEINMVGNALEIKATVEKHEEEKEEGYYFRERTHDSWYRRVPMPGEFFPEKAEAELKDGLLLIHVPKKEPSPEMKPKKIRVK